MYRNSQPDGLPYQRNFHVRLEQGHLLIATTRLMVAVHHFSKAHGEPDYTIHFLVSDNPDLAPLLHPIHGWDFVGLINFLWRKLDILRTLDLRDETLRAEFGLSTVSIPSQTRQRQEKRSFQEGIVMICEFVMTHPNCTRLEISRHLGRSKNPYILTQIEWCVNKGQLARTTNVRPNGALEYRYIWVGEEEN